jgi:hypothetical protein
VFDQVGFCYFKCHYKKQPDVLCSFVLISQAIGLIYFIILILHLDSASKGNEYQEYFPGVKGGRCVVLATLPHSCADCLEFWEPQLAGGVRACLGLQWNCFVFFNAPSTLDGVRRAASLETCIHPEVTSILSVCICFIRRVLSRNMTGSVHVT